MTRIFQMTTAATVFAASLAFAHSGVANEAVKARMEAMKAIGGATGTIGKMVQGKADFDAAAAQAAAATMAEKAAMIPALFEAEETDPESEAKPEIWTNWDDFVAKGSALEMAAKGLDTSSLDAMKAGFGPIGAACADCHKAYRVKK